MEVNYWPIQLLCILLNSLIQTCSHHPLFFAFSPLWSSTQIHNHRSSRLSFKITFHRNYLSLQLSLVTITFLCNYLSLQLSFFAITFLSLQLPLFKISFLYNYLSSQFFRHNYLSSHFPSQLPFVIITFLHNYHSSQSPFFTFFRHNYLSL